MRSFRRAKRIRTGKCRGSKGVGSALDRAALDIDKRQDKYDLLGLGPSRPANLETSHI